MNQVVRPTGRWQALVAIESPSLALKLHCLLVPFPWAGCEVAWSLPSAARRPWTSPRAPAASTRSCWSSWWRPARRQPLEPAGCSCDEFRALLQGRGPECATESAHVAGRWSLWSASRSPATFNSQRFSLQHTKSSTLFSNIFKDSGNSRHSRTVLSHFNQHINNVRSEVGQTCRFKPRCTMTKTYSC